MKNFKEWAYENLDENIDSISVKSIMDIIKNRLAELKKRHLKVRGPDEYFINAVRDEITNEMEFLNRLNANLLRISGQVPGEFR